MGGIIEYNGNEAYYNLIIGKSPRDDTTNIKFQLRFYRISDLEQLLSLKPDQKVSIDNEKMSFSKFRREVLNHTHKIYPIEEGYFIEDTKRHYAIDKLGQEFNKKYAPKYVQIAKIVFSSPKIKRLIKYKGKKVVVCNTFPSANLNDQRYELIFDKLGKLEEFIFLNPQEKIRFGKKTLTASEFKEDVLSRCDKMYISPDKIPTHIEYDHAVEVAYYCVARAELALKQMFDL